LTFHLSPLTFLLLFGTMPILKASLAYFAIVFTVGFLCGPIRVLMLEPMFGATAAVVLEAPILLMAMLYAARFVPRRLRLTPTARGHLGMGCGALVLVLLADLAVGLLVRDLSVAEIFAHFGTPAGRIYAALLLAFALLPWLVNRRARAA
jgi:hypothetical protein